MGVSKNKSNLPQDQLNIETCTRFCTDVESLVANNGLSYIEAVVHLADLRKIEEALAANYLNPDIIEKVRIEGENRNMLERTASLPF
jgi:hypothetical protein